MHKACDSHLKNHNSRASCKRAQDEKHRRQEKLIGGENSSQIRDGEVITNENKSSMKSFVNLFLFENVLIVLIGKKAIFQNTTFLA